MFFLSILSFFTFSAQATSDYVDLLVKKSSDLKLYEDRQWLKLGHYNKALLGGYESEADSLNFFTAGESGASDPHAELEATIRAMFSNQPHKKDSPHPQCHFPARLLWLQSKLGIDPEKLPRVQCPEWDAFRARMQAQSVTLVFSSYYLNNPSSTFGHTLIRLNKTPSSEDGRRYELLDFGINYAATVTTQNPMLYAFFGLTGLFDGSFTAYPYYYKVREYNDYESRDLWEYDLTLSPLEVEILVAHFWEAGFTRFRYFYIDENCSYHMVAAIDAATPKYALTETLPAWVIPGDTVKSVYNAPGLVSKIHYRPAVRTLFSERAQQLSKPELEILDTIVTDDTIEVPGLTQAPATRQAAILDAAMDYVDWKYAEQILKEKGSANDFKQKVLQTRARVPLTSPPLKLDANRPDAPHLGHGSDRMGAGGGYHSTRGPFMRLHQRFALHDLSDPSLGFPDLAQIEFIGVTLKWEPRIPRLGVEDFSLVSVYSLLPIAKFARGFSWNVRIGSTTVLDAVCDHCHAFVLEGGPGATLELLPAPFVSASVFIDGEFMIGPSFKGTHFRLRAGPTFLLRSTLTRNFHAMIRARYRTPLFSKLAPSLDLRPSLRAGLTQNLALDLSASWMADPRQLETAAAVFYYF